MKHLFTLTIFTLITFPALAQLGWQQHVDTKINVALDDKKHFLNGYEEFVYTNNSPDTLAYIYIHLWPNAYKNDRTPFSQQMDINGNSSFYYSKQKDRGYIDSLQFTVDGRDADYHSSDNIPDIARIDFYKPLLPGQKVKIATPFRVKIPAVYSRMGHNKQAYFISQWFPKPAVYDRKGWHPISYQDQGEFYSNYGSYDMAITTPKNYIVLATGNCTDEGELHWLDSLSKLPLPSDTLYSNSYPVSDAEMKTVHYHEDNVHDFAWFADKRWIVRKDTVYSPGNNQLVTAWAAFLPDYEKIWVKATDYLKETVRHYGTWVGPYQYKTIKAVLGDMKAGGGMEYPTITIIDRAAVINFKTVVIHEAGHNWFYGMLGTNERDDAWMDEGLNTFYEKKTMQVTSNNPDQLGDQLDKLNEYLLYYQLATDHTDQIINQTSANFTKLNYGVDVYYKTSLMLRWLEKYMGYINFKKGMQDYYDTWKFKHPYPDDLEAVLQKHTDKPIDWFFKTILNNNKPIDYKITDVSTGDNETDITISNRTHVNGPVCVDVYNGDSLLTAIWSLPFENDTTLRIPKRLDWTRASIDFTVPDDKKTNNDYRNHALFHRFGISVRPIVGLNLSGKDPLFVAPALGYNQYDGFMLGLVFHDLTIPEERFRYALAPMYGFNSKSFVGAGSVGYMWYPGNIFKNILLQGDAKSFNNNETNQDLPQPLYARYMKFAPSLNFTFNERNPLSTVTRMLTLKGYYIQENNFNYGTDSFAAPTLKLQQKVYGLLRYTHRNDRNYNPFSYSLEGQLGADFAKINAEGNVRIDYFTKDKSLYVRGYIGKFFPINNDPAVTERYELNSSYTGIDDYLYDGTYLARTAQTSFAAQQISIQEGGFKVPVYNNADRSDDWMATINLKTDLPLGRLPVRLFFDAGLIPNANPTQQNPSTTRFLYDGGVEVYTYKDIVSLYIPIIMSSDFQNYLTSAFGNKNKFGKGISFTLQLQNINWLKAPEKVLKTISN